MQSKWDTWLTELARIQKGGVRVQGATRGSPWVLLVRIEGDYSGASFRGEVRSSPDATGAALASLTFSTPNFADGWTSVTASLAAGTGANSTGSLPADNDMDGVEEFPFDILMTPSGGAEDVLVAGVLPLLGRVTV